MIWSHTEAPAGYTDPNAHVGWDVQFAAGPDDDLNAAGALLHKTLLEMALLIPMLEDTATQQWWADLRANGFFSSYLPFMIGDFLFDIQGLHAFVRGTDLITGEQIPLGTRLFIGGMTIASVTPWGKILPDGRMIIASGRKASGVTRGVANKSIDELSTVPADLADALARVKQRGIDPTGSAVGPDHALYRLRRDTDAAIATGGADMIRDTLAHAQPVNITTLIASHDDDLIDLQLGRSPLTGQHLSVKGALDPDRLGRGQRRDPDVGLPKLSHATNDLPQNGPLDQYAAQVAEPYDIIGDNAVRQFHKELLAGLTGADRRAMLRTLEKVERSLCFPAGTRVLLADGSPIPIEQLRPGDRVLTRDQHRPHASPVARPIVETFTRRVDTLHHIRLIRPGHARHAHRVGHTAHAAGVGADSDSDSDSDDAEPAAPSPHDPDTADLRFTLETTAEHPFHVLGRGWTRTADLRPGDRLRGLDADWTVDAVALHTPPGPVDVHNVHVDATHTYFVLPASPPGSPASPRAPPAVWAHNACEDGMAFIRTMLARADKLYTESAADIEQLTRIYQVKRSANWGDIGALYEAGDSKKLRRSYELMPNSSDVYKLIKWKQFQAQHVIPGETAGIYRIFFNGGLLPGTSLKWPGIGLLVNHGTNCVPLPANDKFAHIFRRPRHSGYHPGYSEFVDERIEQIQARVIQRLTAGETIESVLRDAIDETRSLQERAAIVLRNGHNGKILPLHKNTEFDSTAVIRAAWKAAVPDEPAGQ